MTEKAKEDMAATTSTLDMSKVEEKLKSGGADGQETPKRARLRVRMASFHPQNRPRVPGRGPAVQGSVRCEDFDLEIVAVAAPSWPPNRAGRGPDAALIPHLMIEPKDAKMKDLHEPVMIPLSSITDWEPLDEELLKREQARTGTTQARVVGR